METETEWKARLVRTKGPFCVLSVHGHLMQSPGWPDLYVAPDLWIELKLESGVIATNQVQRIRRLNEAGARALFVERRGDDVVYTPNVYRMESTEKWVLRNTKRLVKGATLDGSQLFRLLNFGV